MRRVLISLSPDLERRIRSRKAIEADKRPFATYLTHLLALQCPIEQAQVGQAPIEPQPDDITKYLTQQIKDLLI